MEQVETPTIDWDAINLEDLPLCKVDDPSCTACE